MCRHPGLSLPGWWGTLSEGRDTIGDREGSGDRVRSPCLAGVREPEVCVVLGTGGGWQAGSPAAKMAVG